MKLKYILTLSVIFFYFLITNFINAQEKESLSIQSIKEVGQIEVGNPYVGIEVHKSFPLLNRISFYYPVANSIDISEDYWKRENYRIMTVGLKVGDSPKRFLKNQIYKAKQTPYSVLFEGIDNESAVKIKYEFCKNKPAMVITYEISNNTNDEKEYEVYTRLDATLRTSHTYNIVDTAYTEYLQNGSVIKISYPFVESGNSQVFMINAGLEPASFTTKYLIEDEFNNPDDWWLNTNDSLPAEIINKQNLSKSTMAYIYEKTLAPNSSLKIIQIVGSQKISDGNKNIEYLLENYQDEINNYESYILKESLDEKEIVTGNDIIDFTSTWSKAILTTNAHYLNGQIAPMPAQAEYNFYFTHDALLTDLAAVNFDLDRVKNDLKYIINLADSDYTIPHAYYWKDTTFKTEFAGTENWNHFWFTLVCARYFRHSGDKEFLNQLYPYIEKSIETGMKNKGEDDLMYSFRPDWWDIGNNYGPRAYMTILAIRALREFNYVSTILQKDLSEIKFYDELANRMNKKLVDTLWNNKLNYLTNYFEDGKEDKHIYMGSLLASHFNLLDADRNLKLLKTAKLNLLDEKIGLYTLFPMDLNLLGDYMGFAGNEAGEPYYYANGGVWPHGNAWYALSLISNGLNSEAYQFIKRTMTLDGIINSPNGQPALYEYRVSDKNNPANYGKIDKPQFLWAGGWYLYTLYNLFGLRENEWNISFNPYLPEELDLVKFKLTVGNRLVDVEIIGEGQNVSSIMYDEKQIPSLVIPNDVGNLNKIVIKLGDANVPFISSTNALVANAYFDIEKNVLEFDLHSFQGYRIETKIISPLLIKEIFINNNKTENNHNVVQKDSIFELVIQQASGSKKDHYSIYFEGR
jgi:hypothetical protein